MITLRFIRERFEHVLSCDSVSFHSCTLFFTYVCGLAAFELLCVFLLPPLLLFLIVIILCKVWETPTCGDSSWTGKEIRKKNTVVFKLIIGSLERGWVQPSSIGTPQRGSRQVLYLAEPRDNSCVSCDCFSVITCVFARARYLDILTLNQVLLAISCWILQDHLFTPSPLGALNNLTPNYMKFPSIHLLSVSTL